MVAQAQAQADAALVGDTKRCVGEDADTNTTSYASLPCTVDNARPCMVVDQWGPALWPGVARDIEPLEAAARWSKILGMVRPHLDCWLCPRVAERDAARLAGLHLGKHERRVLLLASPPPRDKGVVIEPEGTGRVATGAHLRAIRTLRRAGLLSVDWQRQTVEAPRRGSWQLMRVVTHRVAVQLSPLGAAAVGRVRQQLMNGTPIRWAQHRDMALAAVGDTTPAVQGALLVGLRADAASGARIAATIAGVRRAPGDYTMHYATALGNQPAHHLANLIEAVTSTGDDHASERSGRRS